MTHTARRTASLFAACTLTALLWLAMLPGGTASSIAVISFA